MNNDQLEFAISQYLDGTLPAEERAALEQVLSSDPAARELLEQYRALNAGLKQSMPVPEIDFANLAQSISSAIDHQETAQPVDEQTELAITQYIDGQLPADEHAEVARHLEANPTARRVAHEYASLNRLMKHALPLPNINWQRLADTISESVADAAERARYSLVWVRRAMQLAAAACILIVVGLSTLLLMNRNHGPQNPMSFAGKQINSVQVLLPDEAPVAGQPIADISIGATNDVADSSYSYAEVIGRSSPRMNIAVAHGVRLISDGSIFQQ